MPPIDPRELLPTERPSTSVPDPGFRYDVRPGMFGGLAARGQEEFGSDVFKAGQRWGEIAADDVANQFQENANKILHGDPNATITNPDGTTSPDLGYLGLKGADALQQRQAYEKRLGKLFEDAQGKMLSADQKRSFDNLTRRYRAVISSQMGGHADQQGNVYALQVNRDSIKVGAQTILANPDNEEIFLHSTADMVNSAVKAAQVQYGYNAAPAIINQAVNSAKAAAAETRIYAIGAKDPMRALEMADHYQEQLGPHYHTVVDHLRVRARQQEGRAIGNDVLTGAAPAEGHDTAAVVRHFEGYRDEPYRDNDGKLRIGYGSDTYTTPDGVAHPVTQDTRVTRADAERDLARRLPEFQAGVIKTVGQDAWDKLSPQAKASVTSVAYNYGSIDKLPTLVAAIKSGDHEEIAKAIRARTGDNAGINRSRRLSEANNISPAAEAEGRTQADLIAEVQARHLPPEVEHEALATINKSYAAQHKVEVAQQAALKLRVDDARAEALNTGNVSQPIPKADFIKAHGTEKGTALYNDYQADVEFGADYKSMEGLSDAGITRLINARTPQPGQQGYAHKLKNLERLTKAAEKVQQQRAADPGGAVDKTDAVKQAFSFYRPEQPDSFKPVIAARVAEQTRLGIPHELQSAISDAEAKQYAAALKPIAKEGTPTQTQEEVINTVVSGVKAKYGDYAQEAMARILYHVTLKKEASEVLASALVRNSDHPPPLVTPDQARKVQIERDAERAATIARDQKEIMESFTKGEPPESAAMTNPALVGRIVGQSEQKTQKPFNEAVDMLRSDPAKYMPYFVAKFGIAKVPPDLQHYIPKPKAAGNGG